MSVNSTPRGNSLENIPMINPVDYFNAEKIESTIPYLAIKKLSEIIDEYFKLKPQLIKKQNQIKGLFEFNQKMRETIQSFIQHEKKVVRKYNKLCQIYAKHFKEYWNAKNVDVNFKDLINPITPFSETFSMGDWKINIQQNPLLTSTPKYEELLLNAIKTHYLNKDNSLQTLLEKELHRLEVQNKSEPQSLLHIRQQLRQLNTTKPTVQNMFDLLEKRKNIENLIKELNEDYHCPFTNQDYSFMDEVARIHSIILNPTSEKLRTYLENQSQIRRSLKKKSKKFRESLQLEFQRIETQITEKRQEIAELQKKNQELEESRNDLRNKYQYLQIKVGVSGKKQKDKNSSNTSIIEDTLNMGIKQTNKKLEIKITELEAQITQLKQEIQEKEQANKHLNVKRELMDSNSEMEELRLKLCSKLMDLGIVDTEAMTSGEMFDQIMEKQYAIKQYQVRDPTASDNKHPEYIDIKITESLPMAEPNRASFNLQTPPQICESIIEKQASVSQQHLKSESSYNRKRNVLESEDKQMKKETEVNELKVTTQEPKDLPVYISSLAKSDPIREIEQKFNENASNIMRKKNYNTPLSSSALLSISQRKSVEEQSKMHDISKVFKTNKSIIDQKLSGKSQQNNKQIDEYLFIIRGLQDKNRQFMIEHNNLRRQIERLQSLLAEKKAKPLSVFESMEKDLKTVDKNHADQIENVCQSIVRELQKLQGEQFTKMMANMEEVIKNFKSSSSNPHPNMNQIPILSKNLTQQEDNLFKSENLIAQLFGGKKQQPQKRKFSIAIDDKSGRLSLHSGEVKFQIKQQKSIYFGAKASQPQSSEDLAYTPKVIESKAENINNSIDRSSIRIDQDQLIDIVKDFEGTSRKKKEMDNSQLNFSQSNLKNSRQRQSLIKSSLRLMDKVDRKLMQDAQFINRIEQKLEEIKNSNESGHDLYWFYKRYRQAMEALESTEAKLRQFQKKKETCMNQMIEEDANLSRHKLEEKIYFLQQTVKDLEDRQIISKEEYENNMAYKIIDIDTMRQNAMDKLIKGILPENYNLAH